jgi:fumarate hydratase, class II
VLNSELKPAIQKLCDALAVKAQAFSQVVKIGRTHLMDATPVTLGQEFSGYVQLLDNALTQVDATLPHLSALAIGGTAVGWG